MECGRPWGLGCSVEIKHRGPFRYMIWGVQAKLSIIERILYSKLSLNFSSRPNLMMYALNSMLEWREWKRKNGND